MKTKIILLIFIINSLVFSQQKTLERKYVPVVVETAGTILEGLVFDEWSAWSYDASNDIWTNVPFQVDERSADGKYNKLELMDGVIGPYDEILFMPQDFGDKALVSIWVPGIEPEGDSRMELAFTDENGNEGWIYLFKNTIGSHPGYFSYINAPTFAPAADTVVTDFYKIAHNPDGWIDFAALANNPNFDLVDRLKLRLTGNSLVVSAYEVSENTLLPKIDDPKGPASFIIGNIRSFHDRRAWFYNPIDGTKGTADYQMQYFPYSFRIELDRFPLSKNWLALLGVKNLRFSLDLNENSTGMTFYSDNNPGGTTIDGVADAVAVPLNSNNKSQWVMATGDAGTILLVLELPQVDESDYNLYYRDNKNGGTNDNTDDTGDGVSYSDMGLWIAAQGSYLKADFLSIKYNAYFIDDGNLTPENGANIVTWENSPLTMAVSEQVYIYSSVAFGPSVPQNFEISQSYPNPFKSGSGDIRFQINGVNNNMQMDLFVYNILGQKIGESKSAVNASGIIKWDAKSLNGQPLPAGIYFYQLVSPFKAFTGKFVIIQ